jgi:hypothetical protein
MTAAAGFPIASAIASAGTSTASQSQKPVHTGANSFRAGLEALLNPASENSIQTSRASKISTEGKHSDAEQSEIPEAGDSTGLAVETDAQTVLSSRNENRNQLSLTAASASALEGTAQLQPHRTGNSTSVVPSQTVRSLQQSAVTLPTIIATKVDLPAESGKQTSSERATPQKQPATTSHDSKTATQTTSTSIEPLAPVPVPVPSPAADLGHAFAPRLGSIPATSDHTSLTTETAPGKTSSGFPPPTSTPSRGTELETEAVSVASADNAEPFNSVPATGVHAAPSFATNTESDAQTVIQRTASLPPSPDVDSVLKASSAQPDPADVSNTLQAAIIGPPPLADLPHAHAAENHGPASRERVSLKLDQSSGGTQQTVIVASQPTLARDSAGITGVSAERAGGTSQSAQPQTVSSAVPRDTFAALDADPGQPSAAWTHTSPRQVEAGYQDPSLGWVSVRADLTPGGLHASVVPNSPEAAQALGSHLSGLNTFLAEHHGGTFTASLAAPENHSSAQGQSLGQNPSQHSQSGAQQEKESSESVAAQPVPSQTISTGSTQTSEPPVLTPAHTGLISVIA